MSDPFSVAAGAVGVVSLSLQLLGGCIKGFVLLSTAQNLGKDASTIVCMLNLQEIQLIDWAKRAGLLTSDGLLDRRLNAAAIEGTLERIQELLQNTDNLKARYGLSLVQGGANGHRTTAAQDIDLSQKSKVFTGISLDVRQQILARARIAQGANIAKRLWWAAVDKDKIEKLVADLHFFVRELWHLLNPLREDDLAESMNSILSNMIRMNSGFEQLVSINEALSAMQKRPDSVRNLDIRSLATAAEVKALQVVLEQDSGQVTVVTNETLPKRQEVLRKLERLSRQRFTSFVPLRKNDTMGTGVYDAESIFIEWKQIEPTLRSKIIPRAENLAALLSISKDQTFRSLQCKGLIEDDGKLGFIFHPPVVLGQSAAQPRSLLDLFSAKGGIEPPSLSDRIRLALRVTQVVRNFHRTGWLHKALRSEHILFFNASDAAAAVRNTDFVLAGFNFARFGAPTEISEQPSADPKHDVYRHPSALGQPSVSFDELMDVYSLGTILLEIAEWRALRYLVESVVDVGAGDVPLDKLAAIQQFLLEGKGKGGTSKLRSKMGDIYASACLICLKGKIQKEEPHGIESAPQDSILDAVIKLLQTCCV